VCGGEVRHAWLLRWRRSFDVSKGPQDFGVFGMQFQGVSQRGEARRQVAGVAQRPGGSQAFFVSRSARSAVVCSMAKHFTSSWKRQVQQ
jgi:hypothetical protein